MSYKLQTAICPTRLKNFIEQTPLSSQSRRLCTVTVIQSRSLKEIFAQGTYWVGQELDWEAEIVPVDLRVELPYWLMVPDCALIVSVNGHEFPVAINAHYEEIYGRAILDSRRSCIYIGPIGRMSVNARKAVKKNKVPILPRRCKTVLRIRSRCNRDVLAASHERGGRRSSARTYLKSFCEAHLEIINHLIQKYRLATYDYFAYELSPWDVPVWFIGSGENCICIVLQDYAEWDTKPQVDERSGGKEEYKLIERSKLQAALSIQQSEGEFELMDALNLMVRGDYSGAVRRVTTAIELQTECVLRRELLKKHPLPKVEEKLKASENDFPGRLRQYEKLSQRKLPDVLKRELETTRALRHSIVHGGKRIAFSDRGQAQRSVDTGRWIFNWLEDQRERFDVREKRIALRSFGLHFTFFSVEITPEGVTVHKPLFPSQE